MKQKPTPEQAEAYAKLRAGILAIVSLDAPDAEAPQEWLSSSFSGPTGESAIVLQVAHAVFEEVRNYDDRDLDESTWDEMVARDARSPQFERD
jgi:hypothetical protein